MGEWVGGAERGELLAVATAEVHGTFQEGWVLGHTGLSPSGILRDSRKPHALFLKYEETHEKGPLCLFMLSLTALAALAPHPPPSPSRATLCRASGTQHSIVHPTIPLGVLIKLLGN